jgi:hypothetical protein
MKAQLPYKGFERYSSHIKEREVGPYKSRFIVFVVCTNDIGRDERDTHEAKPMSDMVESDVLQGKDNKQILVYGSEMPEKGMEKGFCSDHVLGLLTNRRPVHVVITIFFNKMSASKIAISHKGKR